MRAARAVWRFLQARFARLRQFLRHPSEQRGLLIGLLVATIPLWMVLDVQGQLRDAQEEDDRQEKVLARQAKVIARQTQNIANTQARIRAEGALRRSANCRVFENDHRDEVDQLIQSYSFYEDPPQGLEALLLDPRALAELAELERDAHSDLDKHGAYVPRYCDVPGAKAEKAGAAPIGLPEPDPVIPKRPEGIPGS